MISLTLLSLHLLAALSNQAEATNDVSASTAVSYTGMNSAHALFGDHSANLMTDVMRGSMFHKLDC